VRVRITCRRLGELDGVDLSQLEVGIAYHLPPTLAAYLVLTHSADIVAEGEPDRPETMLYRGPPPAPDVADDASVDEDFLDVFEHVCNTTPIVIEHEPLSHPARKTKNPAS
jgi:hypothetical protein